jgi:hypothetical protein
MAKLTNEALRTLQRQTLAALRSYISSPVSEDGATRFDSPAGPTTGLCGRAVAPVSHSAQPESERALQTSDTFGRNFDASLASANLQQSLESRLRQRMAAFGSPEYALTWKQWDMQSGPPICALRASGRRTSDNDFGGWPTPTRDAKDWSPEAAAAYARGERNTTHDLDLGGAVQMVGWPTTRDHKDGASDLTNVPINGLLGRQVSLSPAQTEKRGALNPRFSLWLMGYRTAWALCA